MATYKGQPVTAAIGVSDAYDRLTHLSRLQDRLADLPEQARAQLGQVKFADDSISIPAPPVGELTFRMISSEPDRRVVYAADNSPVPFSLTVDLQPQGDNETQAHATIDVDIPAMLKPMVGDKMQQAADKFGDMLGILFR